MKMKSTVVVMIVILAGFFGSASADLVHRWSFDGNLTDSSGSGNTGTFTGTDGSYVTGQFGQGISLAAGDMVASNPAANIPTLGTDNWTINYWLNLSAAPAGLSYIAGFGDGTNPRGTLAFDTAGNGNFYFWDFFSVVV